MDLISTLVVLIVTLIAIIVGVYAYGMSNLNEIKENWVKYRCNPVYMPLAGAVGSDIMSNFTYCTMQSVQTYAGFVMDPIFNQFKELQGLFAYILGSMQFIRKKIAGTTDAFLAIVNSVFGKIHNTLTTVGQLFGRIRTIMYRIVSIFVVLIHITSTGIQTGTSIDNGPIGEVGRFLCFSPDTEISLADGSVKMLQDIKLGDKLDNGEIVESIMMFDGSNTPLVNIDSIIVSGNHKVKHGGAWIRCEDHPLAVNYGTLPFILCLNTKTHTIPIRDYTFKDYEETDDVTEFFNDVSVYYNAEVPKLRYKFRTTGFKPSTTRIRMEDGSIRQMRDVTLGSRIYKGGRVIGFILNNSKYSKIEIGNGIFVAPGTMVFKEEGLTTAVTETDVLEVHDNVCMNFITEHSLVVAVDKDGRDYTCLDDHEVPNSSIHDKRDQKVIDV